MTPAWQPSSEASCNRRAKLPKGVQGIELIAELSIFAGRVGPLVSKPA
jgi:hypothetical protein